SAGSQSPVPVCCSSVAVTVWDWLQGLRSVSRIAILASTSVPVAAAELPPIPSVDTVKEGDPATDSVADAAPVTVPAVRALKLASHSPAALVVHVSGPAGSGRAPFVADRSIETTRSGAGTNAPVPVSCSTFAVNVRGRPLQSTAAVSIEMRASTHG